MNVNKFQKEMFDRLLKGERVVCSEDGDMVILSDGTVAYVFDKKEVVIDLEKCSKYDMTDILKLKENDEVLTETKDLYQADYRLCVCFKMRNGTEIWVQQKFITNLKDCTFRGNSPTDRLIAYGMHGGPVAVVLPMRVKREREEENQ